MENKNYSKILLDEEDEKEDNYFRKDNEDIFEKLYYEMQEELKALNAEEAKKKENETKKKEKNNEIKDEMKNLKITDRKTSDDLIDFVIIDKVEEKNEEYENPSDKDDF